MTLSERVNLELKEAMRNRDQIRLDTLRMLKSKILAAEGVRQSMILEAEGRMESAKMDALARERLGEAEATVTRLV